MKEEIDNILEGFHLNEYDLLEVRKKLLNLFSVSGSFTAEDMEDAYRDGYENDYPKEWDFNINNYR